MQYNQALYSSRNSTKRWTNLKPQTLNFKPLQIKSTQIFKMSVQLYPFF